jgi:hypothetical protein
MHKFFSHKKRYLKREFKKLLELNSATKVNNQNDYLNNIKYFDVILSYLFKSY